jgi:hypothetical protein
LKILIRQANTNFYINSGDWIEDTNRAHDFKAENDAIAFVAENRLKNVEVVYSFFDPKLDVVIARF